MFFYFVPFVQHDELESSLRDSGLLVQTQKTDHLEVYCIICKTNAMVLVGSYV